jgi:Rieske Fe-S protein
MNEDHTTERGSMSRRLLLAGAVGVAAALAACDSEPAGDGSAQGGADDAGSGPTTLARTSDIPVGGGVVFAKRGVVVTQPTAGTFKAFSAICTHQHCPLIDVSNGLINCGCHGSQFAIEDGSVRRGPATEPLPAKPIRVEGDVITLA